MLQKVENCNTFYYFNYQNQKTQLVKVIMKYTESQLEQAFISLLETEGYIYIDGKQLQRSSNQEVLIKEDLRAFLQDRYEDLEEIELESITNELAFQSTSNLYESNKYICKLLADGFIFKRNNPQKKIYIYDISIVIR